MLINNIYGTSLTTRKKKGFQIPLPSIAQGQKMQLVERRKTWVRKISTGPSKMTKTFPEINKNLPEFHILYKHDGKKSLPKESTYHEF